MGNEVQPVRKTASFAKPMFRAARFSISERMGLFPAGCAQGLTCCCCTGGQFQGFQGKDVCSLTGFPCLAECRGPTLLDRRRPKLGVSSTQFPLIQPCAYPRWATIPQPGIGSTRGAFSSSFQNANCYLRPPGEPNRQQGIREEFMGEKNNNPKRRVQLSSSLFLVVARKSSPESRGVRLLFTFYLYRCTRRHLSPAILSRTLFKK